MTVLGVTLSFAWKEAAQVKEQMPVPAVFMQRHPRIEFQDASPQ